MATIRILSERDIPAVAALFARVYPGHRWSSQAACESYFREMLFDNPWRDLEVPSWVAEEGGRISGCYAVLPRPMLFRGRTLRVAVGFQFMVDPGPRRGLTALQLAQACLSGSQDLTLADGATEQVRRGWLGIGGTTPLLFALHWTRPLRPARFLLSLMEERAGFPPLLTLAARPLCALADALTARLRPNRLYRERGEFTDGELDTATMLAQLPEVLRGYALQPVYDARTLDWLLEQAARKTHQGTLRARAVRDGERRLVGWYIYYLRAGGVSEVVQVAALGSAFDSVLRRLLADAWCNGAAAVRGRLDPRYVQELSHRHCWFRTDGTWTLAHSRHPDVLAAIEQGDAFLSRLEGEWWLRFLGEGGATRVQHRVWRGTARPASSTTSRVWTRG